LTLKHQTILAYQLNYNPHINHALMGKKVNLMDTKMGNLAQIFRNALRLIPTLVSPYAALDQT